MPAEQPSYFDAKTYHSDDLKPLRRLLFEKIREHSFTGLPVGEGGLVELMLGLKLNLADVELKEEAFASQRGDFHTIASVMIAGDEGLFLALLPTAEALYSERIAEPEKGQHFQQRQRVEALRSRLDQFWVHRSGSKDLDLIRNDFQRMHFEIYAQSILSSYTARDWKYRLKKMDDEMEKKILTLLPKSGPAREQILACLARVTRPESKLAEVLVAQAGAEGFGLGESSTKPQVISKNEIFDTFFFGWICALHAGDWSVLDYQFALKPEGTLAEFLSRCACVQALYQVTGNQDSLEEVFKKLSGYGVKKTDPAFGAWVELIELASGVETSAWRDGLETLDTGQKIRAKAEMATGLAEVFKFLTRVKPPTGQKFASRYSWNSELGKIWMHPSAHERATRVLAAVMGDDSGLFSASGITAGERVKLMIETFDWRQVKSVIETRFEGEVEIGLLVDLALKGRTTAASRDDFQVFIENLAPRVDPDSQGASKVWLKVAYYRVSLEDAEGAKAAQEKIKPEHLYEYELSNLDRQIDRMEEGE